MRVSLQKTKTFCLEDTSLKDASKSVVWWYGPVLKNSRAHSVPKIVVFFRRINDKGELGGIFQREAALTHLGLLRIGSVWHNGMSNTKIKYKKETFAISFNDDFWEILSPHNSVQGSKGCNPIPSVDYRLAYPFDKNYLLSFQLNDDRRLLIPCIEFYARYYGHSSEIKRVLATYL
ncbi:hypothetical protein [Acidithiobacillus sp. AMEEHan]|uniref:hypothetical protein n=1 Tax=Acidithiobacillus sp. AMEEHan TaxID=2994951 RepID=UPI0027E4EBA9|nr:hypothetical protein [Acidithiobacillus sp. AMEEHan]